MKILLYILFLSIYTYIFSPQKILAADALCSNEPMPSLANRRLICAVNLGIQANTAVDVSTLINQYMPPKAGIFFPAGKYIISNNIILGDGNSLVGSVDGITIFHDPNLTKSSSIGNTDYSSMVKNLTVKNLILDNIGVDFYGNKDGIIIENNAFINTNAEYPQLSVSHNQFFIQGNVFLRDEAHPGLGISTYRNKKTLIQNNIVGNISNDKIIATLNYYDTETYNVVTKLRLAGASNDIKLDVEQDYYKSAWYATDGLTDSVFNSNIINGNTRSCLKKMPKTENCQMGRDHAVYIKQYNNVDVTSNYFSGWPQDATGSVKFRNAKNLYFAGNYLNQVAFDARAYDNSHILEMSDTFIFNNIIEETSISYWQNFTDTENIFISVKNFIVFNNFFKSKDKNKVRISSTPRNKFGEFLESQNQYTDFVPVTTRDFEHVNISTAKSRLPKEKKALLTLKPAPLWKQAGQITGPNLTDNQLVRMDIHIEGYSKQFVVYVPPSDYYYPAYRWAPGLAQNLNSTIHGVCAGVLTDKVTTNNRCKFLKTTGSSYQNFLYATEGESVKYTINVLDKYKKINAIYAPSALSAGQAVKFNVRFEDGTENEVVYTPSDYMLPAYRWPKGLATEINQRIPGLCAGQYTTEKDNNTEATQCLYAAPVASSYENNIYTINGQSAITTMSIIEIGAP